MAVIISDTSPIRAFANLGILITAKRQGHIPAMAPIVETLRRKYDFFVSDVVVNEALDVVGEGPKKGK